MNRTLAVEIDQSTWPTTLGASPFPATFHSGTAVVALSIPAMLLQIGYLTTPTSARGVSLSEFWAWVRYLAAVTEDEDLRLTAGFCDLDAHQKTILSDDFGMGLPMLWLSDRLDLRRICDGRYFVEHVAASVGATNRRTARRGPNKTPDFVARDGDGVWHAIECKGTQSGQGYSRIQMGELGPPPTGGIAQKRSIVFPPGYTGQRLVCGLSLGLEGGVERSTLVIIDPEPEDPFEVRAGDILFADDAMARSMLARSLRLSGFDATAEAAAAPFGRYASSRPSTDPRTEQARRRVLEEKGQSVEDELESAPREKRGWNDGGRQYLGRELVFDLPRSIDIGGRRATTATVRQGMNIDVLAELRSRPMVEEPIPIADVQWKAAADGARLTYDDDRSRLEIGEMFVSELSLK